MTFRRTGFYTSCAHCACTKG